MSDKRKPGDLVWKIPLAGFVGEPGWGIVRGPREDYCFSCDDENCGEWHEVVILGRTKADAEKRYQESQLEDPIGVCCHVGECEMLDAEDDSLPKTLQELLVRGCG